MMASMKPFIDWAFLFALVACDASHDRTAVTAGRFAAIASDGVSLFYADWDLGIVRVDADGATSILVPDVRASQLAVRDEHLYYGTHGPFGERRGAIARVPTSGGEPIVIAETASASTVFVLDGTNVFFADEIDGEIRVSRAPLEGGEPILVARRESMSGLGGPSRIFLDQTDVFFTARTRDQSTQLVRVPKTGGEPEIAFRVERDVTVLDHVDDLFFCYDAARLELFALEEGSHTTIAGGVRIGDFVADGSELYWVEPTGEERDGFQLGAIVRHELEPPTRTVLASDQPRPGLLAVDATRLLWATHLDSREPGELRRAPR